MILLTRQVFIWLWWTLFMFYQSADDGGGFFFCFGLKNKALVICKIYDEFYGRRPICDVPQVGTLWVIYLLKFAWY